MGTSLENAMKDPGSSPLVRMSTLLLSRDPAGAFARMDALSDANKQRDQGNSQLDAIARLVPGIQDSKGIMWDEQAPAGQVQHTMPSAPSIDEHGNIIRRDPWKTEAYADPDKLQSDLEDRKRLVTQAFAPDFAARFKASVLPAPPKFEKFAPGEVGGMVGADGSVRQTFAAPPKPERADVVTLGKGGQTKTLNLGTPTGMAQFDMLTRSGWSETKTPAAEVNVTNGGDKAVTGVDADRYKTTLGALQTMEGMAPFLDAMQDAMDAGAQTGFGQDWLLPVKQAWGSITGELPKGTSEQEVFQSIQNYLGPKMRTPGSGASSDRDVSLFLSSIPGLSKSREGNVALRNMYNKIRGRYSQVAEIQQGLLREHNYIPVGVERKAVEALGPIFSDEERAAAKGLAGRSTGAGGATTATKPAQAPSDAKQAPDGNWYSPDPARPGKYLKW